MRVLAYSLLGIAGAVALIFGVWAYQTRRSIVALSRLLLNGRKPPPMVPRDVCSRCSHPVTSVGKSCEACGEPSLAR